MIATKRIKLTPTSCDPNWFRDVNVSEKLHDVLCVKNDDFDEDNDKEDKALVVKLYDFIKNSDPTREVVYQIQAIIIDAIIRTTNDISSVWSSEIVTNDDEKSLINRIKQADRKISFILVGFIKAALESSDPKWKVLRPCLMESLKTVFYTVLQVIEFAPHHSVRNRNILMKHLEMKKFLTEVSTRVWYSVLFELETSFNIDDFITIFRKLAMVDCFDEDWYLLGSWDDVLEEFEERHEFVIQRTDVDAVLQARTMQQQGGY